VDQAETVSQKLAKGAAKTITETVLSTIPGIGPILGKLGGMSAEAFVDWLRGQGFAKPDIDLLLDPTKRLTDDFLADIAKIAPTRRVVLMLDTLEKITGLEAWMCNLAQGLHPNLLLVVAGRGLPNWDRRWVGWLAEAYVEEIELMPPEVMSDLVQRYYELLTHRELDFVQAEGIIQFARGLPIAITSAVDLMVKFQAKDFHAITTKVINDLARRLQEDVPDGLKPAVQAAATLRWFDEPTLRAVMQQSDVSADYDELQRFPFVVMRDERFAVHDVVRETLDASFRARDPERYREWHERAEIYFDHRLQEDDPDGQERNSLERLYHRVQVHEDKGWQLFQEMAEGLVIFRLQNRLRALLSDVDTYPPKKANNDLWRQYYNARLTHIEGQLLSAETVYRAISENEQAEPKLRAYSLCDWGILIRERRIGQKELVDKSIWCFETSLQLASLDSKLVACLNQLGRIHRDQGRWDKALEYLNRCLAFYTASGESHGIAHTQLAIYHNYAYLGDWQNMFLAHRKASQVQMAKEDSLTRAEILDSLAIAWIWAGRYSEVVDNIQQSVEIKRKLGVDSSIGDLRDMGLALAFARKHQEATHYIDLSLDHSNRMSDYSKREVAVTLGFLGTALMQQGENERAHELLAKSLELKISLEDTSYMLDTLIWLGILSEILGQLTQAYQYYSKCLEYRWTGRRYFECGALTGLARVRHAQGNLDKILPLLAEAEQLAQQYQYNDHLAWLRLMQGHLAWEGAAQFDTLSYFKQALNYALRFNRFLLDDVLSGRPQGTPLPPIIPACLEHAEAGRSMLIALRDWWQNAYNDIGTPRLDTISPIPEGISLLEAERKARDRELGDGSPQKSVIEQIEMALGGVTATVA